MFNWATAGPAVGASFTASVVEVVEAFTIILAVGAVRGWKPAIAGTVSALGVLIVLVLALGPVLSYMPLHILQLFVGVLLLLFGMGWLRKAILRAAGILPLHDEAAAFAGEQENLEKAKRQHAAKLNWIAGMAAFKAVLLEGLEVVFIVIAVGSGNGLLVPAAAGAAAACALVLLVGVFIRRPLVKVPENQLKFAVGVMLSAFGVFWTGEGLGVEWPGNDLILFAFAAIFLITGVTTAALLRCPQKGTVT